MAVRTWMRMYGGMAVRSTELVSMSRVVCKFWRQRDIKRDTGRGATQGVQHESPDQDTGISRVTGHHDLKALQAYPRRFGHATAIAFFDGGFEEDIDVLDVQCRSWTGRYGPRQWFVSASKG